ncbi:MAG: outer membrane protein assembly factor BamB family protein [Verrucomicrobiia bacterium]
MNRRLLSILALTLALPISSSAGNWGHWRGPTGNSTSPDANPPIEWSGTKNVKWKVAIPGRGSGSPVIWGDRVFVVTAVSVSGSAAPAARSTPSDRRPDARRGGRGSGRGGGGGLTKHAFKILCFDRKSGKLLWEQAATETTPHQRTHTTNGHASASPTTDGEHVYAHFGSRGLYCYTMDGKLVWNRDDFGKMDTRASFGEGSSPTLAGNKIVVPWDHEGQSSIQAFDKRTGKTIWKTERDEPTCWATPLIVKYQGGSQIIMNGQTCARSYDLETGKELWRCAGQTERPVASAVSMGDLVVVGSGFRGSYMGAFRLDGRGNLEGTKSVVWELDRDTPDIASPLLSNGRVYFYKGKSGMLTCADAKTGKLHYEVERISGINSTYASPIAANGHVYLTGRSGKTVVIKDSNKLEVVATNSLGEGIDATPAPVDNELFIRGERHLFCISY